MKDLCMWTHYATLKWEEVPTIKKRSTFTLVSYQWLDLMDGFSCCFSSMDGNTIIRQVPRCFSTYKWAPLCRAATRVVLVCVKDNQTWPTNPYRQSNLGQNRSSNTTLQPQTRSNTISVTLNQTHQLNSDKFGPKNTRKKIWISYPKTPQSGTLNPRITLNPKPSKIPKSRHLKIIIIITMKPKMPKCHNPKTLKSHTAETVDSPLKSRKKTDAIKEQRVERAKH